MIFVLLSSGNKQRLTSCFKMLCSCDAGVLVVSSPSCNRSKFSRSIIGDDCVGNRGGSSRLYDNRFPEFWSELKALRPAELPVAVCGVRG